MEIKNPELFERLISSSLDKGFSGWNFSYIADRWKDSPTTWDYAKIVQKHLSPEVSLLDMDTGGGEFLSSLQPLPKTTYATEGYAPNMHVAKSRLQTLGIKVIETPDGNDSLPFPARFFDFVLNRHGSYSPPEIYRILKPNGVFNTQQVGGQNNFEINEILQDSPEFIYSYWKLSLAVDQLRAAGFEILEQQEEFPEGRILDIGALVYYLKVISWQIADFSIERYYHKLAALHNEIQENGEIKVRSHRFLIVAKIRVTNFMNPGNYL